MCGISGVYCWGQGRLTVPELQRLHAVNEWRGRDASGIAYQRPTGLAYIKRPVKASDFQSELSDDQWGHAAASPFVMLHTRAKTKGSSANEENNHPVVGLDWVVTHNGVIANDDELFASLGEARFAEVDTSALPLVLSRGTSYEDSLRWLSVLGGSATFAAWSARNPHALVLGRVNGNPVHLGYDTIRNLVVWSSDPEGIEVIDAPRIGPMRMFPKMILPDDHVLMLTPDHQERMFKVPRSPFFQTKTMHPYAYTPATVTTNRVNTEVSGYVHIDANRKMFPGKPMPVFDKTVLSWDYCDHKALMRRFSQDSKLVGQRLTTPYGEWQFWKEEERVLKCFKPTKRVRKFLRREFENGYLLPQPIGKTEGFDGKLHLERLDIKVTSGSSITQTFGYACPWCMIWVRLDQWRQNEFRCNFCNIQSIAPAGV